MGFGRAVDRIRHLQRCMGDERLSANAKLFYAYIMAHPKKWTLSLIAEQTTKPFGSSCRIWVHNQQCIRSGSCQSHSFRFCFMIL